MSESKSCSNCGHPNSVDARFCPRCGTPLAAHVSTPAAAPAAADVNRTMLGALIDPNAGKPPEPAAPPGRPMYRTVVGGGFDMSQGPPGPPASAAQGPALPTPPPASSTMGLPPSPMSTPGTRIPDEIAAPPAVAPAPAIAAPIAAASAAPAPSPAMSNRQAMQTMIGVGLNAVPAAAPSQPTPPAPTMAEPASPPVSPPLAPVAPLGDTVVDPPKPARAQHRTMLGMPVPYVAGTAPAAVPVTAAPVAPVAPVAPAAPAPAAAAPAPAPAKRNLGPSNRTMLGVIAPVGQASFPGAMPEAAHAAPPAAVPMPMQPERSAEISSTDVSIAGLPSPRRRVRGWLFALLAVGVLLVGSVIAAGLYYRMTRQRVDVAASVAAAATGETLAVDVTRAPDGTRARFGTTEIALTGTHAEFPLAADALHVGDNVVAIDVLLPDGTTETHSVTLTVEYRVRADLASLSATPPAITVVVDALPGSTVVLDAQPLPLDAQGHGTRAYPVASIRPDSTGTLSLTAHYTVTPPAPAVAATGTLSSRVPTTVLRVERPADTATTDQSSVVVAGTTQPGATVTVDGAPATVSSEGHFSFTAPLAAVGPHELHLAASVAGRVPASAAIHVTRVADLARAAAAFPVDRTLTYARVAAAPTTFVGQHVALEGRVYNVDLQDGHGVLQMLARDCPAGQRCPLWVTHPAIADITVDSWVRVIGTVAGEQQFMSQSGEVRTVPRVDAAFVLPSHP